MMKLNLYIIWDELQEDGGQLVSNDDIPSRLRGVRYLQSARAELSEQFLYVTDAEALPHIPSDSGQLSFVCIGMRGRSLLEKRGWSAILLPDRIDQHRVFTRSQEVFERYVQWEQDMLLSIANGEPLQSIFDRGARYLSNPIALFDVSLAFVMMAGTLPENIENTIWEEVLSEGYTKIEGLPADEQRVMERLLADRNEPFFYQSQGKYSEHQQIIAPLRRKGVRFGTLGMIDIVEPFTLGQLSIVSHLKNFMELALKRDAQLMSISEGASYFVERLLQGLSVEQNAVEYHLNKDNWQIDDDYCLVYCTRIDHSQIDGTMNDIYAFRIRALFEDATVFSYENGILAIIHNDHRIRADTHFADELSLLLHNIDLRCGVSLVFRDFMRLKYAYIQCKTALATSQSDRDRQVHLFETHYTDHIIGALDASTSLKSLCHPRILQLYDEKDGKGQEYVRSLQTYLSHARNATAAAASLFIHRNTLLYRLNRIEERLEVDLETVDQETLFMLYLSCLIVVRLADTEGRQISN